MCVFADRGQINALRFRPIAISILRPNCYQLSPIFDIALTFLSSEELRNFLARCCIKRRSGLFERNLISLQRHEQMEV